MSKEMKIQPLVEETLPKQFIYDLGLYLQTCAHIEVSCCSLICSLEKLEENSQWQNTRFCELRKLPIKELIALLKSRATVLPEEFAAALIELMDWTKRYQINRHIASHGAFLSSKTSGYLKVLYTHKYKENGENKYRPEETEIGRELVLELIADADRILRQIVTLDTMIRNEEITLG